MSGLQTGRCNKLTARPGGRQIAPPFPPRTRHPHAIRWQAVLVVLHQLCAHLTVRHHLPEARLVCPPHDLCRKGRAGPTLRWAGSWMAPGSCRKGCSLPHSRATQCHADCGRSFAPASRRPGRPPRPPPAQSRPNAAHHSVQEPLVEGLGQLMSLLLATHLQPVAEWRQGGEGPGSLRALARPAF